MSRNAMKGGAAVMDDDDDEETEGLAPEAESLHQQNNLNFFKIYETIEFFRWFFYV